MIGALRLEGESSRDQKGESPVWMVQSEAARDRHTAGSVVLVPGSGPAAGLHRDLGTQRLQSETAAGAEHIKVRRTTGSQWVFSCLSRCQQVLGDLSSFFLLFVLQMAAHLPPDQAAIFLSLMTMEGRSFSPGDVIEAVQLNRDFPSALKFLTHSCPICQEQVSFSKVREASSDSANQRPDSHSHLLFCLYVLQIITMTHCSCFLCQTCFKTFFSSAIKEKSIDQLVCPQCGRPEVRGQGGIEEYMDYFSLLDTQVGGSEI